MMLFILLLTTSDAAAVVPHQEALMDEIERTIVLPKGANPFQAYGRNYAFADDHKIIATYVLPSPPLDLSKPGSCTSAAPPNFEGRPCTKEEVDELLARDARAFAAQTKAGTRRWYSDRSKLPLISDGGCMMVTVEYDFANHRFLTVACNGL